MYILPILNLMIAAAHHHLVVKVITKIVLVVIVTLQDHDAERIKGSSLINRR